MKKVIVFGATGKVGINLVLSGLRLGHKITAFARDRDKFRLLFRDAIPSNVKVVIGDALDQAMVGKAIGGHDAVVNAAANSRDMEVFHHICRNVVVQAEKHLEPPKRVWLFGGIPGLKVPGKNYPGIDLPGMPRHFEVHRQNYRLLETSSLDWSFMCPGPMYFANGEEPPGKLQATEEEMPYKVAGWTKFLPSPFHSLIFLRKVASTSVPYQDVADFIMKNLEPHGPYSRKRLGIFLDRNII